MATLGYGRTVFDFEAAIRKNALPIIFKAIGLEKAKDAMEQLIEVTRIGLSRGEL